MTYKRTIVCLANSRKLQGRCVAGLEWNGQTFGDWLRPVARNGRGELTRQRYYADSNDPKLLDIVEIEFLHPSPLGFHVEDHLIDETKKWIHKGEIRPAELENAVEKVEAELWVNADSTANGMNDLIPAERSVELHSSLKLVRPDKLDLRLHIEGADFGKPRRRVRGYFSWGGSDYILSVTDPIIENEFQSRPEGTSRTINQPFLCLSVSEIFEKQNAHYKLIAGVIESRS